MIGLVYSPIAEKSWDERALRGKTIAAIGLTDDRLVMGFSDGTRATFWDDKQDCCERRYLCADGDDLSPYVGAELYEIEIRKVEINIVGEFEEHNICFLEVVTSKGCFTLSAHNEHNGYYSGFDLCCTVETAQEGKA